MKRFIWIGLGVFVLAALWAVGASQSLKVDVAVLERGRIRSFVEEEGRTRVVDRYVVSVPVAGRLQRVTLKEGDTVAKGDIVGEIDPVALKSRVGEAQAQVRALKHRMDGVATKRPKEAELERARVLEAKAKDGLVVARREHDATKASRAKAAKDLTRAKQGLEEGTGSSEDVDIAVAEDARAREQESASEVRVQIRELEIKAAHLNTVILESRLRDFDWEEKDYGAQIAALEESLTALNDDLRQTKIHAPAGGTVLNVFQESEQVVPAGTQLMEVGDLRQLEVEADFLSEDVAHMKVGMPAEIFGRALGDRAIEGKISRIHPSAFQKISSLGVEQQRVRLVIGFEPGEVPLGDQFRIEVRVILDEAPDALLVPEGALFRHERKWHVFKVVDGAAKLTPVETGLRDGRQREVISGLQAGDSVILHPDDTLEDGTRVAPLE